jgi:glycogen debranching enzyme
MIQQSFEKHFFIPKSNLLHAYFSKCLKLIALSGMSDDEKYAADSGLVNRRGIYKDTFGSELKFGDYQLRPNVCVAMTVV